MIFLKIIIGIILWALAVVVMGYLTEKRYNYKDWRNKKRDK